ncbi:MAG TPA: PspC domain-containing protein [Anaerolineae bacterium]|nr:PspC domain-containing protein [Anaerolineae bacterium]HOQ98499.1 PspC domain-containing protein [Anaerolineae bacterium]HPL28316.1 PspC domain-containing protein [Anaerolineae bacterium]
MKKLYRSRDERMVAGVAGGIAQYFGIDPTLVRLAFAAATLAGGGSGLLAYIVLAMVMPLEPVPGMMAQQAKAPSGVAYHFPPEEETRAEVQETRVTEYER